MACVEKRLAQRDNKTLYRKGKGLVVLPYFEKFKILGVKNAVNIAEDILGWSQVEVSNFVYSPVGNLLYPLLSNGTYSVSKLRKTGYLDREDASYLSDFSVQVTNENLHSPFWVISCDKWGRVTELSNGHGFAHTDVSDFLTQVFVGKIDDRIQNFTFLKRFVIQPALVQQEIGFGAFRYLKNLEEIVSRNSKVIKIGEYAFAESSLKKIGLQNTRLATLIIGDTAFESCSLEELWVENLIEYCKFKTQGTILNNTKIMSYETKQELVDLVIPNGSRVTEISKNRFRTSRLISVDLDSDVSVIGEYAFAYSPFIAQVKTKAVEIRSYAFYLSYGDLTTIEIGANQVCSLASRYSLPSYSNKVITIKVPSNLIDEYKVATNWSSLYQDGKIVFEAIE